MSRKRRPLAAPALIAMVALISACGSTAPASTGTGSGSSGGGNPTATNHEKAVKFAECIRTNGVSEFPDPDASGNFAYGIKTGSPLDPSSAEWQKAIGACKNLEPARFIPTHFTTTQTEARLKFAQCVRANGVNDFPDPTATGPLVNVPNASSIPGFDATVQKCIRLNPGATQ
jgi:hypothetical protein